MTTSHENKYEMRILRVDLGNGQIEEERIKPEVARKYVGGTGLGAKFLYEEVPPGVEWSDPKNRMMMCTGPLAGTKVAGFRNFFCCQQGAHDQFGRDFSGERIFWCILKILRF